jgi:hypothetical protein
MSAPAARAPPLAHFWKEGKERKEGREEKRSSLRKRGRKEVKKKRESVCSYLPFGFLLLFAAWLGLAWPLTGIKRWPSAQPWPWLALLRRSLLSPLQDCSSHSSLEGAKHTDVDDGANLSKFS